MLRGRSGRLSSKMIVLNNTKRRCLVRPLTGGIIIKVIPHKIELIMGSILLPMTSFREPVALKVH
jgi:hypothetical protein